MCTLQEGCVNITEWLGVFGLWRACVPAFFGPSFGLALVPLLGPIADNVRLELYDGPGIETARGVGSVDWSSLGGDLEPVTARDGGIQSTVSIRLYHCFPGLKAFPSRAHSLMLAQSL